MVDIHCHILPETDDGAKTWDIAIEMCRIAARDGITHIVATPHANDRYPYDRNRHEIQLEKLRQSAPDGLQFSLGCDFHFSYDNIEDALVSPERYAITGSKYLLIELSDYGVPPGVTIGMERLTSVGLSLILTHPERNPFLQRRPEQVLEWANAGCIVQVTASSITGFWGKQARNVSKWLLERDAVHVIATDAHDTSRRPPLMSEAGDVVSEWIDPEVARALVEGNPGAIVAGQPLPFFPAPRQ